jgi:hypothetical protein
MSRSVAAVGAQGSAHRPRVPLRVVGLSSVVLSTLTGPPGYPQARGCGL